MRNAYLIRLAPRYVKTGNPSRRGTLISPGNAASEDWGADQRDFYKATVGIGLKPEEPLVVEFGQPPYEFSNSADDPVGALVIFVMGAESSQGSDNPRGLLGLGTISSAERTNDRSGASMRIVLEIRQVIFATPIVSTRAIRASPFLDSSGLWNQTIFGWEGAPSAQNCYPLHDRGAVDDDSRMAPAIATIALMRSENSLFAEELDATYPALSAAAIALGTPEAKTSRVSVKDYAKALVQTDPVNVAGVDTFLRERGFTFDPWQVSSYLTATRTKPFVILAGISGTGKTKLPILVAQATAAECEVVSVRPDWTDSTDLLGYTGLDGEFRPGPLLRFAAQAMSDPQVQHFFVLDEMNIARVEYYLAEVLSCMERRDVDGNSAPLLPTAGTALEIDFSEVVIPPNLCLVGSVNMDESTFDFSRKVLDRAFVLEFGEVDLTILDEPTHDAVDKVVPYSSAAWRGEPLGLAGRSDKDSASATSALNVLASLNVALRAARMDIGYRVRDEFVAFVLEANRFEPGFRTRSGESVLPLDIAISAKLLPRIQGSDHSLGKVLETFEAILTEESCDRSAARVRLMAERLKADSFTSYF